MRGQFFCRDTSFFQFLGIECIYVRDCFCVKFIRVFLQKVDSLAGQIFSYGAVLGDTAPIAQCPRPMEVSENAGTLGFASIMV